MDTSEDVVGNDAAAAMTGVRPGTWRTYVARGQAPQPYRREVSGGHALPVWRRADLDAYMKARPGQGARTDLRPETIHRSADGDQGPDLPRSAP